MKPRWLPDWENDLAKYPKITEKSRVEWAWQFLRRNPKYQQLWGQLIRPHYKRAHVKASLDRADRDGPYRGVGVRRPIRLEEIGYQLEPFVQFGISTIPPDPAEPKARLRFSAEFIRYTRTPSMRPNFSYKLPIVLTGDEVVVWLNLNRSIDQQLAKVRTLMKDLKTRRKLGEFRETFRDQQLAKVKTLMKDLATERELEPFRFQPKAYQRYLRLLDARSVGAKNSEIARILYPHLLNEYPEYEGNRQVRTDLRTAERLRDRDFLRIVAGGK
jgi:Family of unknown function (DUF6499)